MIKRFSLVLLCAFFISGIISAQTRLFVRGKVTYNVFSAGDLKIMQSQVANELRDLEIPVSTVESFSPGYGMQLQVLIPVKDTAKLSFGVYYERFSTSGKLLYKKNSHEIGFDQVLNANAAGLILEKKLDTKSNLDLCLSMGLSLIWTSLDMKTYEQLNNQRIESPMAFSNFTVGLLPGLSLSYNLYAIILSGSIAYQVCLPSSFYYNGEVVKKQNSSDPYRPGIEGIRLGFGLGYGF